MQHWWLLLFQSCVVLSAASTTDGKAEISLVKSSEARSEAETFFYEPNRKIKTRDSYIPVLLKRNDKKIEARIPVIIGNRTTDALRDRRRKTSNNNNVPVVRGAAVPLRSDSQDLQAEAIEGLHAPSQTAVESWSQQQVKYPDSNGYYPTVGDNDGGYPSTSPRPRPTYGVPSNAPPPNWGCPSVPWGQGEPYPHPHTERPTYPNPYDKYPPTTNNYPSSGCMPPQNYPPSCPPANNYPPSQNHPSGYPSTNNYPQYPSSSSNGNYPSSSNGNYPQQSHGAQSPWHYSGRPWKKEGLVGQWHPCRPFDLTATAGRRTSFSGCPQELRSANTVRFEPDATPVSKIDDKNNFENDLPKDVEMLKH